MSISSFLGYRIFTLNIFAPQVLSMILKNIVMQLYIMLTANSYLMVGIMDFSCIGTDGSIFQHELMHYLLKYTIIRRERNLSGLVNICRAGNLIPIAYKVLARWIIFKWLENVNWRQNSYRVFLVETGKELVISKVGMNLREYNF